MRSVSIEGLAIVRSDFELLRHPTIGSLGFRRPVSPAVGVYEV
jgi:hypothetical protein